MTTSKFLVNKNGTPTEISDIIEPYTFYKDIGNGNGCCRYILNHKKEEFILDITIEDTNGQRDVQIQKYYRKENTVRFTELFNDVVCDGLADRKRYKEITPDTIGGALLYEIAYKISKLTLE